jgi:hypothetical protein
MLDEIGAGGMSRVYRARRVSDGETVAVKMIHIENMAPDFEARLLREPEVQQGIGHENVVRLYESFRERDEFFLVMEYIDGRSLARIIHHESGPMSFEQARGYFEQVLHGVEHLHSLGIVHRDIKPSNILVDRNGVAKLADFGIAKFTWEGDRTATRMGLGTPQYMSPEQVSGSGIDHRSDIYALGITLYEMLTGRRPFAHEGSTPMAYVQVIQDVLNTPLPEPRQGEPTIPMDVVRLIDRATAKRREDRFQSCTELLEALRAIAPDEEAEAPPTVALTGLDAEPAVAAPTSEATMVLAPVVAAASREYAPGGVSRSWSGSKIALVAIAAMLLLAGIVGYAAYRNRSAGDDSATADASEPPEAETATTAIPASASARAVADDLSKRYARALFDCRADEVGDLYADVVTSYLGRHGIAREAIARDFEASCEQTASVQGVNVIVDSVAPSGAASFAARWRITAERRFADGSLVLDSAVDLVQMARVAGNWVITAQDRLWGKTHLYQSTGESASMKRSHRESVEAAPEDLDTTEPNGEISSPATPREPDAGTQSNRGVHEDSNGAATHETTPSVPPESTMSRPRRSPPPASNSGSGAGAATMGPAQPPQTSPSGAPSTPQTRPVEKAGPPVPESQMSGGEGPK